MSIFKTICYFFLPLKYYQALSEGSIPIHLGLTTDQFQKFKPSPNSALNVADFDTIEELANRIKQLSNDRTSYESMLNWKNQTFPQQFDEILGWGKVISWLLHIILDFLFQWSSKKPDFLP
jgi:hypothetical protein